MLVKINNGVVDQFPYTIGQLRKDNPNTSFPKIIPETTLEQYGVYAVEVSDAPSIDARTHTYSQDSEPTLIDGAWVLGVSVTEKNAEEIAAYDANVADNVRSKRDQLLAETDWRFRSDLTPSQDWADYCQALRDITAHENFPYLTEADWPVKPN